ncbi:UNVERIFIED_CONTAM: hypothetical protein C3P02_20135 [Clostridioides difficile]
MNQLEEGGFGLRTRGGGGGGKLIFGSLGGFLGKIFLNQGGIFCKESPTADETVAEGVSLWWVSGW